MEAIVLMLVEVMVATLGVLFEATLMLIPLIIAPIRFLVSREYREKKRDQWKESRARQISDITFSTITISLFTGAMIFWISILTVPDLPKNEEPMPGPRFTSKHESNLGDGSNSTFKVSVKINVDDAKQQLNNFLKKLKEKGNPNQELQPTVTTPPESGNVQGTAAEL